MPEVPFGGSGNKILFFL